MSNAEEKLKDFEDCFRRFIKTDEITFMLLTVYESDKVNDLNLAIVESNVQELNDESLSNLYKKIQEDMKFSGLYQPVRSSSYYGFLQRLGTLLKETTIRAREVDVALRESIGIQSAEENLDFINEVNKIDKHNPRIKV
jgi:hypothetical protein